MDNPSSADWTAAGAHRVVDGVHRIPLPLPGDGLRAVNVYSIEGRGGLTLIDGGWAHTAATAALEQALHSIDRSFADVTQFLVTHLHRDHYTLARRLGTKLACPVTLGIGEQHTLNALRAPGATSLSVHLEQLRSAGAGPIVEQLAASGYEHEIDPAEWAPPDVWLEEATSVRVGSRELEAIPTAGHTRGHVVYADVEDRLTFAGDHVLPHITPSIGFEAVPSALPLRDYMDSLKRMKDLPDAQLLPAHGPIANSVHRRVDELLQHHDRRLQQTLSACHGETHTAYETAQILRWTRRQRSFAELDPFNQMLATFETAAHLDVLVLQQRAEVFADGAARRYCSTPETTRSSAAGDGAGRA